MIDFFPHGPFLVLLSVAVLYLRREHVRDRELLISQRERMEAEHRRLVDELRGRLSVDAKPNLVEDQPTRRAPTARRRVEVNLSESKAKPSCALCWDPVGKKGWRCASCGSALHRKCREELGGGCPSVGCGNKRASPRDRA